MIKMWFKLTYLTRIAIYIILCTILTVLIIYLQIMKDKRQQIPQCYMNSSVKSPQYNDSANEMKHINLKQLDDILYADIKPKLGRSIFFIETSCIQKPFYHEKFKKMVYELNFINFLPSEACAIESAAKHNPNTDIFVMFATPTYQSKFTDASPLIRAIHYYSNIHLRNVNIINLAADTPAVDWLKISEIYKSRCLSAHLSEILRLLTLWRWGGTFMDLSIVTYRSLEDIPPNYVAIEYEGLISNSVLNIDGEKFGADFSALLLYYYMSRYYPYKCSLDDASVITYVLKWICKTTRINCMYERERCMGFKLFPANTFYTVDYENWKFVVEMDIYETLNVTEQTYVGSIWNADLKKLPHTFNQDQQIYEKLLERSCPYVYAAVNET